MKKFILYSCFFKIPIIPNKEIYPFPNCPTKLYIQSLHFMLGNILLLLLFCCSLAQYSFNALPSKPTIGSGVVGNSLIFFNSLEISTSTVFVLKKPDFKFLTNVEGCTLTVLDQANTFGYGVTPDNFLCQISISNFTVTKRIKWPYPLDKNIMLEGNSLYLTGQNFVFVGFVGAGGLIKYQIPEMIEVYKSGYPNEFGYSSCILSPPNEDAIFCIKNRIASQSKKSTGEIVSSK